MTFYGTSIDVGRTRAIHEALKINAKYIWFVDDDTVPPHDAGRHLMYLLDQNGPPFGKVMVAAGIYTTRSVPPEPLVFMEQGAGPHWDWKVGETFKCWGLGTGCMMINMDVFKDIPEPWFVTRSEAHYKETDDLFFCTKVQKAGFEAMAHGGILCHHYNLETGAVYQLPRNSQPYLNRGGEYAEPKL